MNHEHTAIEGGKARYERAGGPFSTHSSRSDGAARWRQLILCGRPPAAPTCSLAFGGNPGLPRSLDRSKRSAAPSWRSHVMPVARLAGASDLSSLLSLFDVSEVSAVAQGGFGSPTQQPDRRRPLG